MFAILSDENIVIACKVGTEEEMIDVKNKYVKMNLDNSPAVIGYYWDGQRFTMEGSNA